MAIAVIVAAVVAMSACRHATADQDEHSPALPVRASAFAPLAPSAPQSAIAATVERVIDGDTLIANIDGNRETIRLLGIDTPEKPKGPRPAECFGTEATDFADALLPPDTTILLSRDQESRDQYGRLLAYVHRIDGVFVNLAMVEHGYASPLSFAPNTTLEPLFDQAADEARRAWIGFWPACGASDVALLGDSS